MNLMKQQRNNLGLKQAQAVKCSKTPIRSYQNYESGIRTPDVYTAIRISKALSTTAEKLFPLLDEEPYE